MTTPVDMWPLFWWVVGAFLVCCAIRAYLWMERAPASHVDPGDRMDPDELVGLTDTDACPACGEDLDGWGSCGCSIQPRRRLERDDYGSAA